MVPGSRGPQSQLMWASPQISPGAGAHRESQASAEAGGTEDAVSLEPDVSRRQGSTTLSFQG